MKVITWNVNSIRLRSSLIYRLLEIEKPDILCLQETKVVDNYFPIEPFNELGYEVNISGQKSYNGVALISKQPTQQY